MRRLLPTLLAAALALAACGSSSHSSSSPASISEGKAIFARTGCGACHTLSAVGARGRNGPDFDTSEKLTRAQILTELNVGANGMPSYTGRLTAKQQAAVATFLYAQMQGRR